MKTFAIVLVSLFILVIVDACLSYKPAREENRTNIMAERLY